MKSVCFKPYKGVSSNVFQKLPDRVESRFKPYKGVSSNRLWGIAFFTLASFKPYKGVSSNLNRCW